MQAAGTCWAAQDARPALMEGGVPVIPLGRLAWDEPAEELRHSLSCLHLATDDKKHFLLSGLVGWGVGL